MSPEAVVKRQVEAYNARDLQGFVAAYSDGNRVIDHERITGVRDGPYEVAAVYEVADGLIQTVWFFSAD